MRLWLASSITTERELSPLANHFDAFGGPGAGLEPGNRNADEGEVEQPAAAADGRYGLTSRERAVLELLTDGKTDKVIAEVLRISPLTVHKHVGSILSKMGAHSRTEASTRALREGLVE